MSQSYHPPSARHRAMILAALKTHERSISWLGRQLTSDHHPNGVSRQYMHMVLKGIIPFPDPEKFDIPRIYALLRIPGRVWTEEDNRNAKPVTRKIARRYEYDLH